MIIIENMFYKQVVFRANILKFLKMSYTRQYIRNKLRQERNIIVFEEFS